MPLKIHQCNHFKVYSLAFNIITLLYNHPHDLIQNVFITLEGDAVPLLASWSRTRSAPHPPSVSVDLPGLHISYKWKLHLVLFLPFFS